MLLASAQPDLKAIECAAVSYAQATGRAVASRGEAPPATQESRRLRGKIWLCAAAGRQWAAPNMSGVILTIWSPGLGAKDS